MAYDEYVELYMPNRPDARSNGRVSEHRLVAEKTMGRRLTSEEHVHHVNGQKKDNRPENLWVFRTKADHARFHQTGAYQLMEDGTFISPRWFEERVCPTCQKTFIAYKKQEVFCCNDCKNYAKRKVKNRPTKSELLRLLISNSVQQVAEMYGLTSRSIRYWCECDGISLKKGALQKLREKNKSVLDMDTISIKMKLLTNHKTYTFYNIQKAIEYVRYKELTTPDVTDRVIRECILRVIHGKRKTYLNREWSSPEYLSECERIKELKEKVNTKHIAKQMEREENIAKRK